METLSKLYLVKNVQERDAYVINICISKEAADRLKEEYDNNFKMSDVFDAIEVEEVNLDIESDVVWDLYNWEDA